MPLRLLRLVFAWLALAASTATATGLMHELDLEFGMDANQARAAMTRNGWAFASEAVDTFNNSMRYMFTPVGSNVRVRRSFAIGAKGLYSVTEFWKYPKSRRGHADALRKFESLSKLVGLQYGKSKPASKLRRAYLKYEGWQPTSDLRLSLGLDDFRGDVWYSEPHYSLAYSIMDLRWYPR